MWKGEKPDRILKFPNLEIRCAYWKKRSNTEQSGPHLQGHKFSLLWPFRGQWPGQEHERFSWTIEHMHKSDISMHLLSMYTCLQYYKLHPSYLISYICQLFITSWLLTIPLLHYYPLFYPLNLIITSLNVIITLYVILSPSFQPSPFLIYDSLHCSIVSVSLYCYLVSLPIYMYLFPIMLMPQLQYSHTWA